ncbi:serine proteinase [Hahella sp. CCB-MM4]|uniref:S8 family serine peptidase n=1 Tax=Hahella sp. (strain CCB-MM4) TaxID=1926491 RepID=UPI000B9B3420|nr:S8 family serine peptidase [Hahella sp. CCB-MM4]OZG72370.1 serine proteinase [Hahella sp. CCB-MM4]
MKQWLYVFMLWSAGLTGGWTFASAEVPPFQQGELVIVGNVDVIPGYTAKRHFPDAGLTVLTVTPGSETREISRLRGLGIEAHLNRVAQKFVTTSDPFSSYQWHFDSVQAQQAWTLSTGEGVVVAILDTGLNSGGPDGVNCVVSPASMLGNPSGFTDGDGHGTHVSGTVAQKTNNGVGVAGLAHGSCIMPVKVLSDEGSGTFADIAAGIVYAVDHGARVINMSLGISARYGITHDAVMDPALDYAYAAGVTVVAAAGNDGFKKNVSYPAIYDTTLAVGATDYRNTLARYSNQGTGLDLVAPGGNLSTDANGDGYADGVLQETFDSSGFGYWFYQGTSMASPHVTAIVALLIAHGTASSPDDVKSALTQTALDLGETGPDAKYGYGLIQAYDALQWGAGGTSLPQPVGSCTDLDGDGVCAEEGDCDDSNAQVYPGFNEKGRRSRDGLDNDCNGIIDG